MGPGTILGRGGATKARGRTHDAKELYGDAHIYVSTYLHACFTVWYETRHTCAYFSNSCWWMYILCILLQRCKPLSMKLGGASAPDPSSVSEPMSQSASNFDLD